MVDWLCLTSHRQQGHLERAPPFTVPCEGREVFFKCYGFYRTELNIQKYSHAINNTSVIINALCFIILHFLSQ